MHLSLPHAKRYVLSILLALFFCADAVAAEGNDDPDIVIVSAQDVYEYKFAEDKIIIDRSCNTVYQCVKRPVSLRVAEFYDDFTTIKKVSVKGLKGVKPQYSMFSKEGIFYSDTKFCHFTLPFLRKDDQATISISMRYSGVMQFTSIALIEEAYVRNKTVKIIIPAWLQVELCGRNFNDGISVHVETDQSGNTIYTYTVADQPEFDSSEENAPPSWLRYPYIVVVPVSSNLKGVKKDYFGTYDGVYAWVSQMASYTAADTTGLATVQRRITDACDSEDQAIRELYSWVQSNIRYIAFEQGLAGYVPTGAATVYANKYGDCKGMANLLKALLRSRGLDARLAWIWSGRNRLESEIPVPEFNHMICVLFHGEKTYYLDPTVRYMAAEECYDHIQGKMALVEDGANYLRIRTPEFGPEASMDSLHCQYRIDNGALIGKAVMTLSGVWKESMLNYMDSSGSSMRTTGLTLMLQAGRVNDQITDITVSGIDTHKRTVSIGYNERRRSGYGSADANIYVDMDMHKDWAHGVIDTAKRKNDYMFACKGRIVRQETVAVPDGYEAGSLPEDLSIDRPNYSINVSYTLENDAVVYRKTITIKDVWLKKENFGQYNADILRLRRCYGEQVVFRKKA